MQFGRTLPSEGGRQSGEVADPTGAGTSRCAFLISSNDCRHWLIDGAWRRPTDGPPASRPGDATRSPAERLIVRNE